MTMDDRITQAWARLGAIAQAEHADSRIAPGSLTRAWLPGQVVPTAIVLLHGITNAPPQYALLGDQLAARGHAVIVPRMPYHGFRDRLTDAIAALRAPEMQAAALDAVAIAALSGRRVVVAGISVGAVLAGWLAARTAIDTAIAIAPFCGIRELAGGANDALGCALRALPNRFAWWDPRRKEAQPPPHGYPRFATRTLGESLAISTALVDPGARVHARRAFVVLNARDPIVNNPFARRRFARLVRFGVDVVPVTLDGLPEIHDIIEPEIPEARTDLVYPRLIELIERP
ncbi:hypothetical protein WPS_00910 [Vulcanimicrobium alpinum]|uniref:AB hydrolase-1 domain-containing protein n=2 Tax=Vulcanimicrobium alpinum TaxID=3016050 RepID=A0AAN2C798_UNVUL|nr:hypothetical protein WPS_00910 [Vulcanimicrobium alpinum]